VPRPSNIAECQVRLVDGWYVVVAYPEAEVTPLTSGAVLVSIPVAVYDEQWEWHNGGYVYSGAEPQHVVLDEAEHWARSLTVVPV